MKLAKNQKQLFLFLGISVVSIVAVLFFTVNGNTISALGRIEPLYLVACLFVWAVAYAFDAFTNIFFVRGAGERIGLPDAVRLVAIRIFFNLITPFASGGQPASVFVLHKIGISPGKGSSIVVTRLMCLTLASVFGAFAAFVFLGDAITENAGLQAAFAGTGIVIGVSYCVALFALLNGKFLRLIVRFLGFIGAKVRLVKNVDDFYGKSVEQAAQAKKSFILYFTVHPWRFALGLACCFGWYVCQVFILFFIIRGLGIPVDLLHGFALSAMLIFLISFMPTPGASGFGELLFVALFSGTVKTELVGIAVVLWRIFYQYITAGLGGFFTARFFSELWKKQEPDKKENG